jgi:hypothetical protein
LDPDPGKGLGSGFTAKVDPDILDPNLYFKPFLYALKVISSAGGETESCESLQEMMW